MSSESTVQSVLSSPLQALWMDLLQPEVCERIARFTIYNSELHDYPGEDARSLAEASPTQPNAVVAALDYAYCATDVGDTVRCTEIFKGQLRELSIYNDDEENIHVAVAWLKSPALRRVNTCERADYMNAIAEANSVKRLYVHVAETDHGPLLGAVSTLSLAHLELKCMDTSELGMAPKFKGCIVDICNEAGTDLLSSRCPTLEALILSCSSCDAVLVKAIIESLSSLRAFIADTENSGDALIPALQRIESVRLDVDGALALATQIGRGIVQVNVNMPVEDLTGLRNYPRLEDLRIYLGSIYEERNQQLMNLLPYLHQLRTLRLIWEDAAPGEVVTVSKRSDTLLKLVTRISCLESLELDGNTCGLVSDEEMSTVFQTLGQNLKSFEMTFDIIRMDSSSPHERLATLLEAAATYRLSPYTDPHL